MQLGMDENNIPKRSAGAEFLHRRDMWIRWVIEHPDLTMCAKVVGTHLAMRMSAKKQTSWPNIKTMGKLLSVSARHAQRGMHELEGEGLLTVTRIRGRGNVYSIRLPSDP